MNTLYSKRFMTIVSFVAIICSFFLFFRTTYRIIDIIKYPDEYFVLKPKIIFKYFFIIFENLVFIGLYIFLIFHPQKFIIIGITALIYSFDNLLSNVQLPYIGIPMFILCIGTFAIRGFFKTHKKIKISIFTIYYLNCLFVPFFYVPDYLEHLFTKIAISLVTIIALVFLLEYSRQIGSKQATASQQRILNIAKFKGLDRSDQYLLQQVLDNKKYKEIAQSIHGSEGALRNKLSKIYKILEVGDRTGFLTIYSGYELIYEPEQSETVTN